MEKILKEIIKKKAKCYFVSPHLDDAVLSAGGVMNYLAKKTDVTVVNVFTKGASGKNTLSAKVALKKMGFTNTASYFQKRREEDKEVMNLLGLKVINLGYVDALWRKKNRVGRIEKALGAFIPELLHVYPTYRLHVEKGNISKHDSLLSLQIGKKLSFIKKDAYVFCPVGIGEHVDHLLVTNVCTDLPAKIIYWSDFPYNVHKKVTNENLTMHVSKVNLKQKVKQIKMYKTQIDRMFPKGLVPTIEEIFYT